MPYRHPEVWRQTVDQQRCAAPIVEQFEGDPALQPNRALTLLHFRRLPRLARRGWSMLLEQPSRCAGGQSHRPY